MTDRELLQMALNALITAELDGNCEYGAVDALRAALAQPEQEPIKYEEWNYDPMTGKPLWGEQPEQEPVAYWRAKDTVAEGWDELSFEKAFDDDVPLYTVPPQRKCCCGDSSELGVVHRADAPCFHYEQREVYCGCGDEIVAGDGARCGTCVAVKYKEKEWQGLTDEEREVVSNNSMTPACVAIAIEAKLKEKNSTSVMNQKISDKND